MKKKRVFLLAATLWIKKWVSQASETCVYICLYMVLLYVPQLDRLQRRYIARSQGEKGCYFEIITSDPDMWGTVAVHVRDVGSTFTHMQQISPSCPKHAAKLSPFYYHLAYVRVTTTTKIPQLARYKYNVLSCMYQYFIVGMSSTVCKCRYFS